MNKILINFAHPAKSRSKINRAMREAVEDLQGITVNDLYANYPDFLIDVKREQELCHEHDVIIFQHPFYWYSTPAIMKEWQDLVLEHGWAYGSRGNALKGKICMQAITAGGDETTYQKQGANGFSIIELTQPFQAMAHLCKMKWLPPFSVLGIHRGMADLEVISHSENYRRMILSLRDDTMDLYNACQKENMDCNLDSMIRRV